MNRCMAEGMSRAVSPASERGPHKRGKLDRKHRCGDSPPHPRGNKRGIEYCWTSGYWY